MYKQCNSFSEQSACVASVANRCDKIRVANGYPDEDARAVALNNVAGAARANQMILNLLDSWVIGDELVRQVIPQLLGISPVSETTVRIAGDLLKKQSQLGFPVVAQFQIENCVRNLLRELGQDTSGGFYKLAKRFVSTLNLSADRHDILYVPALIRNSLHANGIHHGFNGTDTVTVLHGVTYEFRHEQHVDCASWEHIAHALECSVEVLEEAFATPQISNLPAPIMDQYAWEKATTPPGS